MKGLLFAIKYTPALGSTNSPIKWLPWTLSMEVKRPKREDDHSPPYSVKVKNACSYASTPQYGTMQTRSRFFFGLVTPCSGWIPNVSEENTASNFMVEEMGRNDRWLIEETISITSM
jgi:hypothetical protein